MEQIEINDGKYFVGGRELQEGMAARRYDRVAGAWYEGKVGVVSSYDFAIKERVSFLHLIVPGYAPSPFMAGDEVEFDALLQQNTP